jgi:hypothetical protein
MKRVLGVQSFWGIGPDQGLPHLEVQFPEDGDINTAVRAQVLQTYKAIVRDHQVIACHHEMLVALFLVRRYMLE